MATLIQRMGEDLVSPNYAESTIRSYLHTIEDFRRYAQKRLDHLGPDDIRRYQVYLREERKRNTLRCSQGSLRCSQGSVCGRTSRPRPARNAASLQASHATLVEPKPNRRHYDDKDRTNPTTGSAK